LTKIYDVNELANFSKNTSDNIGAAKKDLLKTGSFNVVLVCLEAGQEIPPHPEPYAVCFYVINGKGMFTVGNEQVELSSGGLIFVPVNETRGILSREKLTLLGIQDPH
jgi:quercetin dioxygenase-like cupin family protein